MKIGGEMGKRDPHDQFFFFFAPFSLSPPFFDTAALSLALYKIKASRQAFFAV